MSFITRCPACSTAFKVVPDQLKISDGWVRCGQCQHIFDATLDLQPWWPGLEQAAVPQSQWPQQDSAPDTSQAATQEPLQQEDGGAAALMVPHDWHEPAAPVPGPRAAQPEPAASATPTTPATPAPPEPPEPHWAREPEWDLPPPPQSGAAGPQPLVDPGRADPAWSEPAPDATDPAWASPATMELEPVQAQQAQASQQAHLPAQQAQIEPEQPPTVAAPSFVRRARRRAFWQHPLLRFVLALLALALALLLGLQAAYQWRAPVLRELPALQPVLEAVCETLDCQQALPSGPNEVVIDSSVLLRRAPGIYVFNVVLRNQSVLQVASPAIELTLTDIHDQVLVRRVLLPHEWPRPSPTLAPGAEWALQFELAFDGIEGRVMTGYRAILFYP